jgi:hypothetical protein
MLISLETPSLGLRGLGLLRLAVILVTDRRR